MASPRTTRRRGQIEKAHREAGRIFAGVDEVGRGCLAGPVAAGCAILNFEKLAKLKSADRKLIRDSKLLSTAQRRYIIPMIKDVAIDWQVAWASVDEIERHGILPACFLAMRRALSACKTDFDLLLVDGKLPVKGYDGEQEMIVKGDNLCFSIAAASILAKEARDDFMRTQDIVYPYYGFADHVGYGTRQHIASITAHGICSLHRRNFDPIRSMLNGTSVSLGIQETATVL